MVWAQAGGKTDGAADVKPAGPPPVVTTSGPVKPAPATVAPAAPVAPAKQPTVSPAGPRVPRPESSAATLEPRVASPSDLRRFEEQTFPRDHAPRVPPPQLEGGPGERPEPRPSAMHPPPTLRGKTHAAQRRASPTPRRRPARFKGLSLPDLPVTWDSKLIRYLRFYRSHPRGKALMRYWLRRKGRYEAMIARTLRQQGLPRALAYVAMIESSYDPTLTSRVGAAGLWQFMPHSGRAYGLRRDHWIDERRNPLRSTEAAARHLKELFRRFGSWELALAAYNAGPGMVIAAMRKYNTNDYWQLCRYEAGLPWSTTLYVPKILAAAIVGGNRARFGFGEVQPDPPFEKRYELVALRRSATIGQLARATGASRKVLSKLNPELRRGRTPPRAKVWVRVPRGTGTRCYEQLAAMHRVRYRPYVVKLGDSDQHLASLFGIGRRRLRQINGIRHGRELRPGLTILVPARAMKRRAASAAGEDPPVVVALPDGTPRRVSGRQRVFYRVVIGDSLAEVARHLQVATAEIASWNGLKQEARLVSGMVLQAFVEPSFDRSRVRLLDPTRVRVMVAGSDAFLDQHEQSIGRQRLSYRVRKGDTLRAVARRFGLSVGSLMRINRLARSARLKPGQRLVVYVEQRRARRLARTKRRRSSSSKRKSRAPRSRSVVKEGTRPGTKLAAKPRSRSSKRSGGAYLVQPGDTLSGIALRHGVTVKRLMALNRLGRATDLRAGQRLVVPRKPSGR